MLPIKIKRGCLTPPLGHGKRSFPRGGGKKYKKGPTPVGRGKSSRNEVTAQQTRIYRRKKPPSALKTGSGRRFSKELVLEVFCCEKRQGLIRLISLSRGGGIGEGECLNPSQRSLHLLGGGRRTGSRGRILSKAFF